MAKLIQWPERGGPMWPLYPKCTLCTTLCEHSNNHIEDPSPNAQRVTLFPDQLSLVIINTTIKVMCKHFISMHTSCSILIVELLLLAVIRQAY